MYCTVASGIEAYDRYGLDASEIITSICTLGVKHGICRIVDALKSTIPTARLVTQRHAYNCIRGHIEEARLLADKLSILALIAGSLADLGVREPVIHAELVFGAYCGKRERKQAFSIISVVPVENGDELRVIRRSGTSFADFCRNLDRLLSDCDEDARLTSSMRILVQYPLVAELHGTGESEGWYTLLGIGYIVIDGYGLLPGQRRIISVEHDESITYVSLKTGLNPRDFTAAVTLGPSYTPGSTVAEIECRGGIPRVTVPGYGGVDYIFSCAAHL